MGQPANLGKIISDAYIEAAKRGVDMTRPECTAAMTAIAMETLSRQMAAEREKEEKENNDLLRRQFRRDPHMHPDNWVQVIWPNGRAFFYRKDLGPPQEVIDALATCAARIV